jgi:hypothetical protein
MTEAERRRIMADLPSRTADRAEEAESA